MNVTVNNQRPIIRDSTPEDMAMIQQIFEYEVLNGSATFEEIPPSVEEMQSKRNSILNLGLPYLTAELNGQIVGFSYATSYRPRPAYRNTVEDSVYILKNMQGQGIGLMLLSTLIDRCKAGGAKQMIAVIGDSANIGSITLHERLGFRLVGTLEAVGFKLGRWVDTVLMQRAIGAASNTLPD